MSTTEATILSDFLLPPAPLQAIVSLQQFTELFPRSYQTSSRVQVLYRELQHQRAIDIDDVKRNIAAEVKRGERQKREMVNARRKAKPDEFLGIEYRDIHMENQLIGHLHGETGKKGHTLQTILPEMVRACAVIEAEVALMEAEATSTLVDIKSAVEDLSDLRYGRISRAPGVEEDLGEEVLDSLARLEAACTAASKE